jgi:hypothetical protein
LVDVFTGSIHARKSMLLFQRALQPDVRVGVIAGHKTGFCPARWWLSPAGIYLIVRNTAGYLYAVAYSLAPAAHR